MTAPSPPRVQLPTAPRVQLPVAAPQSEPAPASPSPQVSAVDLLNAAPAQPVTQVAPQVQAPVAAAPVVAHEAIQQPQQVMVESTAPTAESDADYAFAQAPLDEDDPFVVPREVAMERAALREERPSWYERIEGHFLVWAQKNVSDVQIVSDAETWVVDKDRHVATNVIIPEKYVLQLAEYWQAANEPLGLRSGSDILVNSPEGTFETMQQIGDYRARIIFRRQDTGYGMTMRFIPPNPPSLDNNPLPNQVTDLLKANNGLFIVSGPTGSGKTTLLATLINEYNRDQHRHIYTLEDPIEFVHRPINSLVTQRQKGRDFDSWAEGIMAAVRSKAQVILVGELRELDAIEAAIEAANKGHLVFATQHASSVASCVSTLVTRFPGDKQNAIRADLAEVMRIIMVQRLVPTIQGGLTPVHEIMLEDTTTTPRIKEGLFSELQGALKPERNMISFEQSLWNLFEAGRITEQTAFEFANNKEDLVWRFDRWNQAQAQNQTR